MTPEKVQQMINAHENKSQFSVSAVPQHKHTGASDGSQISYSSLKGVPQIYAGYLSSGVAVFLPAGWTSVKNGAGNYTVTHNLGTTRYAVVATSVNGDPADFGTFPIFITVTATNFRLNTLAATGNLRSIDTDANFILFVQP